MSVPDQGRLRRPACAPRVAMGALLVALVALVGVVLPSAPIASAATPDGSAGPIVFYGRGYGHGVGMSQYGARGRALAGQDAATILAHYYEGTTPGTTDPKRPVRILVLQAFKPTPSAPLRIFGRGGSWTIDGVAGTFPRDAQLRVTKVTSGLRLVVRDATGKLLLARTAGTTVRVRAGAVAGGRVQVWSRPGSYDRYRGTVRLRSTAAGIDAINETELDLYLRGVVPAEMPATWPIEALRAQAIAARTYAARRLHPRTGFYDLYDDSRTQVYRGSVGERPTTTAVVTATAGQVLRSGTAFADTLFHSTGGGATEDNENVFTTATGKIVAGPLPYLRGSPDRAPDGTPYDAAAPRAEWQTGAYTMAQLSTVFGADPRTNAGAISSLDLSDVGVSGRLVSVTIAGSLGTKTVSGEVFRDVFNAETPAADPYMWSTLVSTSPIP